MSDVKVCPIQPIERLPEEDAYRVELVRGLLVRTPRPTSLHGRIAVRLGRLLDEHAEAGGHVVVLAEAGVLLSRDPDTVRGPDLAFYSNDRVPADSYAVSFWGAPLDGDDVLPGFRLALASLYAV